MLGIDLVRRCSFIALTDELKINKENKFHEDIVNLPNKTRWRILKLIPIDHRLPVDIKMGGHVRPV